MKIDLADISWTGNNAYVGTYNIARICENVGQHEKQRLPSSPTKNCTEVRYYFPAKETEEQFDVFEPDASREILEEQVENIWLKFISKLIDYSEARMYVIYDHPSDFPYNWAVRLFVNNMPTNQAWVSPSLEEARKIIPKGYSCFPRLKQDDPCITEAWL